MQVNILFFGQLTDITGTDKLQMNEVMDTFDLVVRLQQQFPALKDSKYIVAVDKKVISVNIMLSNNCTVALLPPFSGG
jgi:molybdopterin converting factor small subunit